MYITEFESLRFVNILHNIVKNYNLTKHSFLNASPLEVETNKNLQFKTMILHADKYAEVIRQKPQFNVVDVVRISLKKNDFPL